MSYHGGAGTDLSAYACPFPEAFAAPPTVAWYKQDPSDSNALSVGEQWLCEEYLAHGRPDLAAAVRGGRKYHRLEWLLFRGIGGGNLEVYPDLGKDLAMLRRGFIPSSSEPLPATRDEWVAWATSCYGEDEGFKGLLARHASENKSERLADGQSAEAA